jgi:predicted phosphodiesterase
VSATGGGAGRIGLLADIHANYEALVVALRALASAGTDRYIVAGDLIGYGPQPNECVDAVARLPGLVAVAGNHEQLVDARLDDGRLPGFVRASIQWTRSELTADSLAFLGALPQEASLQRIAVTHAGLGHSTAYVRYSHQARAQLRLLERREPTANVLVLGHTHIPWVYHEQRGSASIPGRGWLRLDPAGRQLVNPGSVGQSRIREAAPKVRFAQLDTDTWRVRYWASDYDYAATRLALRTAGQPENLVHLEPSWLATSSLPVRAQLSRVRDWLRST